MFADTRDAILSAKVIDVMHALLGGGVQYPALSFMRTDDHVVPYVTRRLHSDAAFEDQNFSIPYPIINTGIYLQDHTRYSGSLKIKPGSHTRPCVNFSTLLGGIKQILLRLRRGDIRGALTVFDFARTINIPSMPGDLIIWYARTHHSGYGVRLRWLPSLSLHPVIENWLPRWLCLPDNPERDVILSIFAGHGEYFEDYMKVQKRKLHRKQHFLASNMNTPTLSALARELGVELRNDGHEYASDPASVYSARGDYYQRG